MRRSLLIFISFVILFCRIDGQPAMKLVASHILFRHGDRTPITTFPTDPFKETDWPNGYGQLTTIGIEQHHRLGGYLRTRYASLLNSSYIATEIVVRSTDYDRTLMSAESNLIGLYPMTRNSTDEVPVQPIPIHTVPKDQDFLLATNICPRYDQIQDEVYRSDAVQKIEQYYHEFLCQLQLWTNVTNITISNIWDIADTIFIEFLYNRTPAWANEHVRKNLSDINDLAFQLLYSDKDSQRIRGGPWIQDVWNNMNRSYHGDLFQKVKIYSAHDTTISGVLAFLGINYPHQPLYASALFVDFYKQNSNYFVRVEYLNVTDSKKSYPYMLDGCAAYDCPWETFTASYRPRFPASVDVECARKSSPCPPNERRRLFAAIIIFVTISLVVIVCFIYLPRYFRRKEDEPLLLSSDSTVQIT